MSLKLNNIELVTPGSISTCWGGKYHYLEPYIGCAFNCFYCYAKSRSIVKTALIEKNTTFSKPVLFIENKKNLIELIKQEIISKEVKILKLSRYTDIFTPPFSTDGTSYDILESILQTPVKRIIITTKGIPDNKTINLMSRHKQIFSFNMVVHPSYNNKIVLDSFNHDFEKKIKATEKIYKAGVLTTIHLDPIITGLDDNPELLYPYLSKLSEAGLNRLMFSYLLLNDEIINYIDKNEFNKTFFKELLNKYQTENLQILEDEKEALAIDLKPEIKKKSVEAICNILKEKKFDFVICGLKSCNTVSENSINDFSNICNGLFYV